RTGTTQRGADGAVGPQGDRPGQVDRTRGRGQVRIPQDGRGRDADARGAGRQRSVQGDGAAAPADGHVEAAAQAGPVGEDRGAVGGDADQVAQDDVARGAGNAEAVAPVAA